MFKLQHVAIVLGLLALCTCSYIDDIDGELTNFSFDTVKFKTIKDCSLDKIPQVRDFLEKESVKYPKLTVFIAEGEPRFELFKGDELVDTIRTGRYDVEGFKSLLAKLGLERDESQTWEKRQAEMKLDHIFRESIIPKDHKDQNQSNENEKSQLNANPEL